MPRVSEEYRDARRTQILRAAAVRFSRDGFHRASMHDVIDEAALSPGAVYRYFRGKDEIIAAIALDTMGMVEAAVREALQARRPLADLPGELVEVLAAQDDAAERMRLAVQAWGEVLRNPSLAAPMRAALDDLRAALAVRVRQAQADGEAAPGLDPDGAARVVLAVLQGYLLQHAWQPSLDSRSMGASARDVLRGALARDSEGQRATDAPGVSSSSSSE